MEELAGVRSVKMEKLTSRTTRFLSTFLGDGIAQGYFIHHLLTLVLASLG